MVSDGGSDDGGMGPKTATELVMDGRGREQERGKEEIESREGGETPRDREARRGGWWKAA